MKEGARAGLVQFNLSLLLQLEAKKTAVYEVT